VLAAPIIPNLASCGLESAVVPSLCGYRINMTRVPLQAFCNNLVDHHLILDLAPPLAYGFFTRVLKATQSAAQAAILVIMGLQHHDLSAACEHLNLPGSQVLSLFLKSIKRFYNILHSSRKAEMERDLPKASAVAAVAAAMQPEVQGLDEELEEGGAALDELEQQKERKGLSGSALDMTAEPEGLEAARLRKHAIPHSTKDFAMALGGAAPSGTVQVHLPVQAICSSSCTGSWSPSGTAAVPWLSTCSNHDGGEVFSHTSLHRESGCNCPTLTRLCMQLKSTTVEDEELPEKKKGGKLYEKNLKKGKKRQTKPGVQAGTVKQKRVKGR
jgi:hypothetical protein